MLSQGKDQSVANNFGFDQGGFLVNSSPFRTQSVPQNVSVSRPPHFLTVSTKRGDGDLNLEAKPNNFLFQYAHCPSFFLSCLLLLAPPLCSQRGSTDTSATAPCPCSSARISGPLLRQGRDLYVSRTCPLRLLLEYVPKHTLALRLL
jgi:hypothetical protein